jgi:hypothetical protein
MQCIWEQCSFTFWIIWKTGKKMKVDKGFLMVYGLKLFILLCFLSPSLGEGIENPQRVIPPMFFIYFSSSQILSSTFLFYVVIYHFQRLMVCISPRWVDTQEPVLRMRTFQNEAYYWQKSWCCRVIMNFVKKYCFTNSTVAIITLFAITIYHWLICWMICFILFVTLLFPYWLWQRVIPYT